MKIKRYTILVLALILIGQLCADEDQGILLRGILKSGGGQTFSISNTSGTESKWLNLGQSYKGHKLIAFDEETEKLTVQLGEETFQIGMEGAKLESVTNSSDTQAERLAQAEKILQQMNFETMIKNTVAHRIKAFTNMRQERTGDETDEEFQKFQTEAMERMFEKVDWEPIKTNMAETYAEMFTEEELEGISGFYSTPAGQASLEKMPELQGKTMRAVMPAMMGATRQYRQEVMEYRRKNQQPEAAE
ncbi:MAG: DUF2059 domain-containing protein [Opitutales bacterium]